MPDISDLLTRDSIPSFKFATIGDTVRGHIVAVDRGQARKFGTNEPEFWDDGKPVEQLIVTLQTELRDPTNPKDDGRRRLFAKKPSAMLQALIEACEKAGAILDIGGELAVRFTNERPNEKPGFNAIKEYGAAYKPPAAGGNADMLQPAAQTSPAAPGESTDGLLG